MPVPSNAPNRVSLALALNLRPLTPLPAVKLRPRPHPLQSRSDSEVISPTAMAGGNAGLVLCQVGGQYSGQ